MTVASAAKRAPSEPELAPAPAPRARPAALRGAIGRARTRRGGLPDRARRRLLRPRRARRAGRRSSGGRWRSWPRSGCGRPRACRCGAVVAGGLLAAFAAFTALSALWAPAAETALTEADRVLLYLGVFLLAVSPRDAATPGAPPTASASASSPSRRSRSPAGCSRTWSGRPSWAGCCPTPTCASPTRWTTGTASGSSSRSASRCCCAARRRSSSGLWRGAAIAGVPVLCSVVFLTSSRGAAAVGAVGALVLLALTDRRLLTLWAAAVAAAGSGRRDRGPARARRARHEARGAALVARPLPGPQRRAADRADVRR